MNREQIDPTIQDLKKLASYCINSDIKLETKDPITNAINIIALQGVDLESKIKTIDNLKAENERLKGDKWISVEDRLPEPLRKCLVYYRRSIHESWCIGFSLYNTSKQFAVNGDGIVTPTHWQPLPNEPINK